uniref:C2H2-type domain-containing protein n=1 Tax=Timema tahoe TaxID=61484 RepID=A0A7R9NWJ9_9NEOP|nr:unnamed protein product [Timema tahoe]
MHQHPPGNAYEKSHLSPPGERKKSHLWPRESDSLSTIVKINSAEQYSDWPFPEGCGIVGTTPKAWVEHSTNIEELISRLPNYLYRQLSQYLEYIYVPPPPQSHMVTQHRVDTSPPPLPAARGLLGGLIMGESSLTSSQARPLTFQTPKLACIYCTKDSFTTMEALQLHVYCTKDSFTTMEALQLHVQAMHGELHQGSRGCYEVVQFNPCSILNGEMRDYGGHLHHHQPPSTTPSPHHHTSPTASLPYSCELCTMRFNSLQGLQKHALGVHGLAGDGVAPLYCMHCSLPFPSAALFAEHYVLMHGGGSSTSVRMSSSPPSSSEQLKPTDLSKKSRRHNNQQSPPNKRLKESADVSAPETSTTVSSQSLCGCYDGAP